MKQILLAEDDPQIASLLELHLNTNEYKLTACANGKDALDNALAGNFDLIILDISLPGLSGLEICKELRKQQRNTPVMMLTAMSDEVDKVLALELGADDYLTKPFGVLELMARTKALLRRASAKTDNTGNDGVVVYKNLRIDKDRKKAELNGERLDLTPKEFDLLSLLASNPGKSFTRHELLEKIWGFSFEGYEHTVTAHINRLRIKIETDFSKPEYILTSWGTGYRFSE